MGASPRGAEPHRGVTLGAPPPPPFPRAAVPTHASSRSQPQGERDRRTAVVLVGKAQEGASSVWLRPQLPGMLTGRRALSGVAGSFPGKGGVRADDSPPPQVRVLPGVHVQSFAPTALSTDARSCIPLPATRRQEEPGLSLALGQQSGEGQLHGKEEGPACLLEVPGRGDPWSKRGLDVFLWKVK